MEVERLTTTIGKRAIFLHLGHQFFVSSSNKSRNRPTRLTYYSCKEKSCPAKLSTQGDPKGELSQLTLRYHNFKDHNHEVDICGNKVASFLSRFWDKIRSNPHGYIKQMHREMYSETLASVDESLKSELAKRLPTYSALIKSVYEVRMRAIDKKEGKGEKRHSRDKTEHEDAKQKIEEADTELSFDVSQEGVSEEKNVDDFISKDSICVKQEDFSVFDEPSAPISNNFDESSTKFDNIAQDQFLSDMDTYDDDIDINQKRITSNQNGKNTVATPILQHNIKTARVVQVCSTSAAPKPIHVNVGGTVHVTTIGTLTVFPFSHLGKMFTGKMPLIYEEMEKSYFIDRDGSVFRHILNFCRSKVLSLPSDFDEMELLYNESKFYNIPSLIEALEKRIGQPECDS